MKRRVKRLIERRPSKSPSFCNFPSCGENPVSNWTKIVAFIYGKIFKVNKPITKVLSPEKVLTKLSLQNVVECKMLNHYDLYQEQEEMFPFELITIFQDSLATGSIKLL